MITKLPLTICFILSLTFVGFKSYTNLETNGTYSRVLSGTGLAATYNLDRTGSPTAGGSHCGACHSGAVNNAAFL